MLDLSHKKLDVYQFSLKLIEEVYKVTRLFPKEEQYVLISQVRRAAISISSILQKEPRAYQNWKKNVSMKYPGVHWLNWIQIGRAHV